MIEIPRATETMCSNCYQTVEGLIRKEHGAVYLDTACSDCDLSKSVMLSPTVEGYQNLFGKELPVWIDSIDACILNTTDRCNMDCLHCYHMPDNSEDASIEEIVLQGNTERKQIILMGAEPTVRNDLPELIAALATEYGKPVGIYTNGIRLSDMSYLQSLVDSGLAFICFSLHTEEYIGNKVIFEKKKLALDNIAKVDVRLNHISFSMKDSGDLVNCLELARDYWGYSDHFRLRAPGAIGHCSTAPMYMEDFLHLLVETCTKLDWKIQRVEADNNPYHFNVLIQYHPEIEPMHFRVIRWPSVDEIDLSLLKGVPTAKFVDGIESNFVHQALLQENKRSRLMRERFKEPDDVVRMATG